MGATTSSSIQPQDVPSRQSSFDPVIGKVTQREIELLWEDAYNKARERISLDMEAVLKVNIERRTRQGDWLDLRIGNGLKFIDKNLDPKETYTYRVKFEHQEGTGTWSGNTEVSAEYRSITALNSAFQDHDDAEVRKVLQNFPLDGLDPNNIRQYQEVLHAEERTPSQPIKLTDVQRIVKRVNRECAEFAVNEAVNENDLQRLATALQNPAAGIMNVDNDKKQGYLILLREAKKDQVSKVKGETQSMFLPLNKIQSVVTTTNINFPFIMCNAAIDGGPSGVLMERLEMCSISSLQPRNIKQYQSQLQCRKKEKSQSSIKPSKWTMYSERLDRNEIQQIISETNHTCAVLALNKALDDDMSGVTVPAIRATQIESCGIQERLINEYRIILKETKELKSKRKPAGDSDTNLQPEDIAHAIGLVNGFVVYINLDNALKDDSNDQTAVHLRQLPLKNFEEANINDYCFHLHSQRRDKIGKSANGADVKEVIFWKRLDIDEIQSCIDNANFHCAMRAISVSLQKNDDRETDAALRNRYAKIHNLKMNVQREYLAVLQNAHLERMQTSDEKWREIQQAIDDYNWLLSVNNAIMQNNKKKLLAVLNNGRITNLKTCGNGYVVLLLEAQTRKKVDYRTCQKDDIYRDILTQQEIQEVVDFHPLLEDANNDLDHNQLYRILENQKLKLKNVIPHLSETEKKCYHTLMTDAKKAKKPRWGWTRRDRPYDTQLTQCEVQAVVEAFWRIKAVNTALDNSNSKATMEALQSLKSLSDAKDWGEIDNDYPAEYHTLLFDDKKEKITTEKDRETKIEKQGPVTGFENILTKQEMQDITRVYPWLCKINTFLDEQCREKDKPSQSRLQNGSVSHETTPLAGRPISRENTVDAQKLMTMLTKPACSRYWRTNKNGQTGYLVLLSQAFWRKAGYTKESCTPSNDRFGRWLTKNEIRNIVEDFTWLLDINDAITKKLQEDVFKALQSTRAHVKKPKSTQSDKAGYSVLLLEALNQKLTLRKKAEKTDKGEDEDIYRNILTRQEIGVVLHFHPVLLDTNKAIEDDNKDALLNSLVNSHLQLKELVCRQDSPEDMCYLTLMKCAKDSKKMGIAGFHLDAPYDKYLTHTEIEKILQVHNGVLAVNEACRQSPEETWKCLEDENLQLKESCKDMNEKYKADYLQLLLEEKELKERKWEKEKADKEVHGFEKLLTLDEIQDLLAVHPQLREINETVEKFINECGKTGPGATNVNKKITTGAPKPENGSQSTILEANNQSNENTSSHTTRGKDDKEDAERLMKTEPLRANAKKLYDKIKKAQRKGNWDRSKLNENSSKGYLKLFSVRLQTKKAENPPEADSISTEADSIFTQYLTKEEIQNVIEDWQDNEDIGDWLISSEKTDEECKQKLDKILKNHSGNDIERIESFCYRMEDDTGMKMSNEGDDEEELWGHTYLHLATCFKKLETAKLLVKKVPALIDRDIGTYPDNQKKYLGLTPFHIAVSHGLGHLVETMLEHCKPDQIKNLFEQRNHKRNGVHNSANRDDAVGKRMKGTVFMGQLPLHVAVLSYINQSNKSEDEVESTDRYINVLETLFSRVELKEFLWAKNFLGDTVFHTIMRFVRCFPNDEYNAVVMMKYLDEKIDLLESQKDESHVGQMKRKILFETNMEKKTALQMTTEFGHTQLFKFMMGIKGVYQIALPHDAIYEIRRFDITEMDKVAMIESCHSISEDQTEYLSPTDYLKHQYLPRMLWKGAFGSRSSKTKITAAGPSTNNEHDTGKSSDEPGGVYVETDSSNLKTTSLSQQSVSELLCCQPLSIGIRMIEEDVFETFLRQKWYKYRYMFYPFFFFHLALLVLMCVCAVARASAVENDGWAPGGFLYFCNIYSMVTSMMYFLQEVPVRCIFAKQPWAVTAVHHNIIYRVMMVLFALCLFVDSILSFSQPTLTNWFLLLGLMLGTWLLLFFLRINRFFSMYIVLLNEALFKTVVPFGVLILLQVLVFSVCFHTIFLHSEAQAEDFATFGKSLLTMSKLMIGLTELEDLLSSREYHLAVVLFIVFIVLTFLLMINALIGVMTNRFQDTQLNRIQVVYLQQMSVIIFLEGIILGIKPLLRFAKRCGRIPRSEEKRKFHGRFVLSYRKVPSINADNPENIEHALRKDRKKLDEIAGKVDSVLEQTARRHDGARVLKIFDYSRRY